MATNNQEVCISVCSTTWCIWDWPVEWKGAHQWIPLHIIISFVLRLACTTRPCSSLSSRSQRSAWKPEGFLESNLRGDDNTETLFFIRDRGKRKSSNWNEGIPQITVCHKVILLLLQRTWNGVNMEINCQYGCSLQAEALFSWDIQQQTLFQIPSKEKCHKIQSGYRKFASTGKD